MKRMLILSCMAVMLGSFVSCLQEPDITPVDGDLITLSLGFEDQTSVGEPETTSTKTYLAGNTIKWASGAAEKVIYVFDTKGVKNTFESTSSAGTTREFKGKISENSEISSVIWTGLTADKDICTFENGIFGGTTLKLPNRQNISNSNSFAQNANIAVMKPGDKVLRNVFGYIKYTIPTVGTATDAKGKYNRSNIKSVTFSAAEPLAGLVQIDYTGNVPIAVIEDDNASTSLTVNTRMRTANDLNTLEAGDLYAVVPVGTYTNFNIKVTLADDTSFDLPVSDPVTIVRGKYTTAGTLPVEAPDSPVEPEEPGESLVWPNDPEAFDYGVADKQSRRAEYPEADRVAAGITGQGALSGPVLLGGVTYGGPDVSYYGNRMTMDQVKSTHWSEEYPDIIPSRRYLSFKINRPGAVSFYQSVASKDGDVLRVPTYYLAVVTTVNGVTSAKIVDQVTPTELTDARPGNSYAEEFMKYHVTLTVGKDDLEGITEAATVYVYHRNPKVNTLLVHYYPLTWTVDGEGSMVVDRQGKILLAGDSLVTEYGESSAPQTGWGQCLSAALGGGVQVSNHAIGGESTKSFIDSGKWTGLINSTISGDVVMIQFMHNDQKTAETHATDPATTYRENLKKFISDVRERGAKPVLVTSVLRRQFKNGVLVRSLGDYPAAMRAVATETNVPLIDCEEWSYSWLTELGEEGAEPYYIVYKRGAENPDNTHFTKDGAEIVAKFIADEMIRLGVWVK